MDAIFTADVLSAMLRIATPVMLAALGGALCQKAGIINIAMEGLMLIGAFGAVAFVEISGGDVMLGYVGAILFAVLLSLLFAVVSLKFNANQIIAGIAINMLALGLTAFLLRAVFDQKGSLTPAVMNKMDMVSIPGLKNVPILGDLFGSNYPLVYVAIGMVVVVSVILYKTSYGLHLRSVGESPMAARTAGLGVARIQLSAIIWSGVLCGLAGAYLSTSMVSGFTEDMVQGRGFTAFTAVVFANGNPVVAALVTLLFGGAEAIGIRIELSGTGLSSSIVQMFPYILALVVLTISSFLRARRVHVRTKKPHSPKRDNLKPGSAEETP